MPRLPRLMFEPFEPRLLLSADPITFVADPDTGFDLTLRLIEDLGTASIQLVDNFDDNVIVERALAETSAVDITGSGLHDRLFVELALDSAFDWIPIAFDAAGGDDLLTVSAALDTWTITGAGSGTVGDLVQFTDVENLLGAADNQDVFTFLEGGALAGLLDGGAGGFDTLAVEGGSYDAVSYTATGPDSGRVDLDGNVIAFAGLEPVTLNLATMTDLTIDLDNFLIDVPPPLPNDNSATLADHATAGLSTLSANDGSFETVNFANPTGSLTIDLGIGDDTIFVAGLDAAFDADLTINGESGDDAVEFTGDITLPGEKLSVTAETITVKSNVEISTQDATAGVANADAGDIELRGETITMESGSKLLASVEGGSGFSPGDVTLSAEDTQTRIFQIPVLDITNKNASITLTGATVTGGAVSITATAADENPVSGLPDYAAGFVGNLVSLVNQLQGVLISSFTGIDASVMLKGSDAMVTVDGSTITGTGDVAIEATSKADASMEAIAVNGLASNAFAVSVGFGEATAMSKALITGTSTVTAGGNVSIKSDATATAKVKTRTSLNLGINGSSLNSSAIGASVAIASTDLDSTAQVDSDATVTSLGGNVNISADGTVTNNPFATAKSYKDGFAAVTVALGFDDSDVTALVNGTVTAAGTTTAALEFDAGDVATGDNTVTIADHGLASGDQVVYRNAGNPDVGGLVDGETLVVQFVDANTVSFASGASIDLDNADVDPTATHTFSTFDIKDVSGVTAVDFLNNRIVLASHGFSDGDVVTYGSNGNPILNGLEHGTDYEVVNATTDTFQLKDVLDGTMITLLPQLDPTELIGTTHSFAFEDSTRSFNPDSNVDSDRDTITLTGHGLGTGDAVVYRVDPTKGSISGGVAVADAEIEGLIDGEIYYVTVVDADTIRLAESATEAGAAETIDLTSAEGGALDAGREQGVGIKATLTATNKSATGSDTGGDPKFKDAATNAEVATSLGQYLAFGNTAFAGDNYAGNNMDSNEKFSGAASLALQSFEHDVEARVGASADVESGADVVVEATVTQKVQLKATAGVSKPADVGAALGVAAGAAVGLYDNSALAVIEGDVDAANAVKVDAQVSYPFLTPPLNVINPAEFFKDGILGLSVFLNGDLGFSSKLMNTWVLTKVKNKDGKASIAGSVAVTNYTNHAEAVIRDGADVNQDVLLQNADQTVTVDAGVDMKLVGLTGIGSLGFNESGIKDAFKKKDPFALVDPLGNKAGKGGLGGSVFVANIDNTIKAHVGDADVRTGSAGSLEVTATEDILNITIGQSGGDAGKFGLSGTVMVNDHTSTTHSRIASGASVNAGGVSLRAESDSTHVNVGGAVQKGGAIGIGITVAINEMSRDTAALIGNTVDQAAGTAGTSVNASGNIVLDAQNHGSLNAFTVAAAVVKANPPSAPAGTTGAETDSASTTSSAKNNNDKGQQGKFGLGLSGAVSINEVDDDTRAYINDEGTVTSAGGQVEIGADNDTNMIAAAGSAAIVTTGKTSVGIAGAVGINKLGGTTGAEIHDATVSAGTHVDLDATRDGNLFSLSASGSGALGKSGFAIAGSVSINDIADTTQATVDGADVTAGSDITLDAKDESDMQAINGALAFGGKLGVGASVTLNDIRNVTKATVDDSTIEHGGALSLKAENANELFVFAASIGIGKQAAVAGTVAINEIVNRSESHVRNTSLRMGATKPTGDITVEAKDTSAIQAIAGAVAGAKDVGFGAAVAVNAIDNDVEAYTSAATLKTTGTVTVSAASDATIETIAVGAGGSTKFSLNGSVAVNEMTNLVDARIEAGSDIEADGGVTVHADDSGTIRSLAGAVSGAGKVAFGAAVAWNDIDNTNKSHIDGSTVRASAGNVMVTAATDAVIDSLAAGGGLAGNVGLTGAATINQVGNATQAYVTGASADVEAEGSVVVGTDDRTDMTLIGGVLGVGGKAGIGIANTTVVTGTLVEAYIGDGAAVRAKANLAAVDVATENRDASGDRVFAAMKGVAVTATSSEDLLTVAAGIAGGGTAGIAGSAVVNVLDETTHAWIGAGAEINRNADNTAAVAGASTEQSVKVLAADDTEILAVAGSLNMGGTFGGGAGADVGVITKNTRAWIDTATVEARNDVTVEAVTDEDVLSISAALGVGGTAGLAGAAGVYVMNLTTQAVIGDDPTDAVDPVGAASVHAEGSVKIAAEDTLEMDIIAGSVGGGGTAGLGASAGVPIITKTTEAFVARGASVAGDGLRATGVTVNDGTFNVGGVTESSTQDQTPQTNTDGTVDRTALRNTDVRVPGAVDSEFANPGDNERADNDFDTSGGPLTQTRTSSANPTSVKGIAISAVNKDDVEVIAASGGGAGTFALNVSGDVTIMNVTTQAFVDEDATLTASNMSDDDAEILIVAGSDFHHMGISAIGNISGTVGLGGGAAVVIIDTATKAFVEDGASLTADANIRVVAEAREDVFTVGAGLSGSGTFALAGAVSVLQLDTDTEAWIGDADSADGEGATATAGGSMLVSATDDTEIFNVDGALGIGLAGAGVAGGVSYINVDKSTDAFVGHHSVVDAKGATGLANVVSKGDSVPIDDDLITDTEADFRGLAVQASTSEDVFAIGASGAGGLYGGLAGGVAIEIIDSDTNAYIGGGAQINQAVSNATTANVAQKVRVTAINDVESFTLGGGLAVGAVGVAGGVDVGVLRNDTTAYIGAGANVAARHDVDVNALAARDIDTFGVSAGVGLGALVGSVSVWTIGEEFNSDYTFENGDSGGTDTEDALDPNGGGGLGGTATQADGQSGEFASMLNGGEYSTSDQDNSPDDAPDNTMLLGTNIASAGNRIDSDSDEGGVAAATGATGDAASAGTTAWIAGNVEAGNDINVRALEDMDFYGLVGSVTLSGIGIGGSVLVANIASNTDAGVLDTATLRTGSGSGADVKLRSELDSTIEALAFGGNGGLAAALGAQVIVINDTSVQAAHIDTGATISRAGGEVEVLADSDRQYEADAIGVNLSTGAAAGAAVAIVDTGGSQITATVGQVAMGTSGDTVGSIDILARADFGAFDANGIVTDTVAVSGGLGLAGSGAVSKTQFTHDVLARLGADTGTNATMNVAGGVSVKADSDADAESRTLGIDVGGLAVGVSLATTTITPNVDAKVGRTTVNAGSAITVRAWHNQTAFGTNDTGKESKANSRAGGGGLLKGSGADADAIASASTVAQVDSGASLSTTGGAVTVEALAYNEAFTKAFGLNIGGLTVGVLLADAVASGDTQALMDGSIGDTDNSGATGLTVTARNTADAEVDIDPHGGGILSGTGADASAIASPTVTARIGSGAASTVHVTGDVSVTADSTAESLVELFSVTVGGLGIGVFFVDAEIQPVVTATIGANANVIADGPSGNVTVAATHNHDGTSALIAKQAKADVQVPGGGILDGRGAIPTATAAATVESAVGTGADIDADGAVSITAQSSNRATALTSGFTLSGLGVGASQPTASANGTTKAHVDGTISDGDSLTLLAENRGESDATAQGTGGGLIDIRLPKATTTTSPTVRAYLGNNSTAADVTVSGDVTVSAENEGDADAVTNAESGGFVAVGVLKSEATVSPDVDTWIGNDSQVTSIGGSVILQSAHNYTLAGAERAGKGAHAETEAAGGGAVNVSVHTSLATANADVQSHVNSGADVSAGQDVKLITRSENDAEATTRNIGGGFVAVGTTDADAFANGITKSFISSAKEITAGRDLIVIATSTTDSDAVADAANGGVVAVRGSDAAAQARPTVEASVDSNNADGDVDIQVGDDVFIRAFAIGDAVSDAQGEGGGVVDVGDATAVADWKPNVDAFIGNHTHVLADDTFNLGAYNNYNESITGTPSKNTGKQTRATAEASVGGFVGVSGTSATVTIDSDVDARVKPDAIIEAENQLLITANSRNNVFAEADGQASGAVGVGNVDVTVNLRNTVNALTESNVTLKDPDVNRDDVGLDIRIKAHSDNVVDVDMPGGGSGLGNFVSGTATANVLEDNTTAGLGSFNTVSAEILEIEATRRLDVRVFADLDIGGSALATNKAQAFINVSNAKTVATIGNDSQITVDDLIMEAIDEDIFLDADARSETSFTAAAFFEATANIVMTAGTDVRIGDRVNIFAEDRIRLLSEGRDVDMDAFAFTRVGAGAISDVKSVANATKNHTANINVASGTPNRAHMTTTNLDVDAISARGQTTNANADTQANTITQFVQTGVITVCTIVGEIVCAWGAFCDPETVCEEVVQGFFQTIGAGTEEVENAADNSNNIINFNADVTILGGGDAILEFDAAGNVVEQRGISFARDANNDIVVDDIAPTGGGSISIVASRGTVTGEACFDVRSNFDEIRVTNRSDANLFMSNVDTIADANTEPAKEIIGEQSTFDAVFKTNSDQTTVTIENITSADTDVTLQGFIENPLGTTTIRNVGGGGGDIISEDPGSYVNTRLIALEADSGAVGSDTDPIFLRLPVQPVNAGDPVGIAQAAGADGVDLDVSVRSVGGAVEFDINNVSSSGGDVDLTVHDAQQLRLATVINANLFNATDGAFNVTGAVLAFTASTITVDTGDEIVVINRADIVSRTFDTRAVLLDVDSTVNLGDITAGMDVNLTIGDATNVTADVVVTETVDAGGTASIVATSGDITGDADHKVEGGSIDLRADNGGIGTASQDLRTNLSSSSSGQLDATAGGAIHINEIAGDLRLGNVTSVTAGVELTAAGNIEDGGGAGKDISATSAILVAGGSIGSAGDAIQTQIDRLEAVAGGDVYLDNMGDLEIGGISALAGVSAGGVVDISAMSDLTVSEAIVAGGQVSLDATGNVIVNATVTAGNGLNLDAGIDVTVNAATTSGGGPVTVNAASDVVFTPAGSVDTLTGAPAVTITAGDALLMGDGSRVDATGGDIAVTTGGVAQVGLLETTGGLTMTVGGSITDADVDLGDDLVAATAVLLAVGSIGTAGNPLETRLGRLEAAAGGSIHVDDEGTLEIGGVSPLEGVSADTEIVLTATGDITVNENVSSATGAVTLHARESGASNDITVRNGADVDAADTTTLLAGDDITVDAGSLIRSANGNTLRGDHQDADGSGTTIQIFGSLESTVTLITGEGDDDTVLIAPESIIGDVNVETSDGDDDITVDRLATIDTGTVNLDGQGDSDDYVVNVNGASDTDYVVNVSDTGARNDGVDTLTINGTGDDDTFLLRERFVALLHDSGVADPAFTPQVERVNYDENINARLRVNALAGNDAFYMDDNSSITTLDGGAGDDFFQFGQVFGADPNASVAPGDEIETTAITRGFLSNGISLATTAYGGDGEDVFSVYSNKAVLRLEGGDDNDEFVIRAFVKADQTTLTADNTTEVNAGLGEDFIQYNINAPVSIDGGDGFDTVVAVGSELDDSFVITDQGIFGAGLNIRLDNVEEAIEVDGLEGDDNFFVLGTAEGVVTTIIGGLGNDTISVAGDVTETIISADAEGRSGVINHGVSSAADPLYDGLLVKGVALNISDDERGLVVIGETGAETRVIEGGGTDSYTVSLPSIAGDPAATAVLTVSAARPSTKDQDAGGAGVQVSTDGVTFADAVTVTFDGASTSQQIWVRAVDDAAEEGDRTVFISHSILSDTPGFDGLVISNVEVQVVDNDLRGLIVTEIDGSTAVLEGGFGDSYTVQLNRAPAPGTTVTVTPVFDAGQLALAPAPLVFDSTSWNVPQTVNVGALSDGVAENTRIFPVRYDLASDDPLFDGVDGGAVKVTVIDEDSPGVIVTETDGSTLLVEGGGVDTYSVRLASAPAGAVTVSLLTDGQTLLGSADGRFSPAAGGNPPTVTFDPTNWFDDVVIEVSANPAFDPAVDFVKTFPLEDHVVSRVQGPLVIEGGVGDGADRSLSTAVMLPSELAVAPLDIDIVGDESLSVDRINVHNDSSVSNDNGTLAFRSDVDKTGHTITGFGMGSDFTTTEGETFSGGITYNDLEIVELMLGTGDDTVTIHDTADGAITAVHGGGGDDTITITGGGGTSSPLVVYGDTSQDGSRYDSVKGVPSGNAIAFDNPGNDTIDASASSEFITAYGGPDDDLIRGSQAADNLAGGAGGDAIHGEDGADHIYGDSGFNVDLIARTLSVATVETAGEDLLRGGRGDDYILGDHGIITQTPGTEPLLSTGNVIRVETTNEAEGASDRISGDEDDDRIFGGSAGDVIGFDALQETGDDTIIADNGVMLFALTVPDGILTFAQTNMPQFGGDDLVVGGEGRKVILGGTGSDELVAGGDDQPDVIIGDEGVAEFDANSGNILFVSTQTPEEGDDDLITAGDATNILVGGSGNDEINGGNADGPDIILGDNGFALFDDGLLRHIESSDPGFAGDDDVFAGNGPDVVIAGGGDDDVDAGLDAARDVIVGDNGLALFDATGVLTFITTTVPDSGGSDELLAGDGDDVVLGGADADFVSTRRDGTQVGIDSGADVIVGDNGFARFDAVAGASVLRRIETTDPENGDDDVIFAADGPDVVLGGSGGDDIDAGTDGSRDIVLGDNGFADFDGGGALLRIHTTAPGIGGDDRITTGGGPDVVLGGMAGDTVHGGDGRDVILGDNGFVEFSLDGDPSTLDLAESTDPNLGGADVLFGDGDKDVMFGGTGGDEMHGGDEHDVMLGDHGRLDVLTLPPEQNFVSIFITDADGGGDDTMFGDGGDDFMLGQQGGDTMFGGAGEDDMTGGHNVLFGADGGDFMDGGGEADVMLGDNGVILRQLVEGEDCVWVRHPDPFPDVVRETTRFDDIDMVAGDDTMLGDDGDDIIHGQRGDDTLHGGADEDEIYGELGDDTISGDDGHDVILADVGNIVRDFNEDGTPRQNKNGAWHRDVFLEEVGVITGVIDMDTTPLRNPDPDLARKIFGADLLVLAANHESDGSKRLNADNGAWDTDLLLIDLVVSNDDVVDGGDGEDVIFGQRGADALGGGDDADLIFGDRASNLVPFETDIPQIYNGIRLIGVDGGAGLPFALEPGGTVITAPVNLLPDELTFSEPRVDRVSDVVPEFQALAGSSAIARDDGLSTVPYITVIPDVVHHADVLPANDTIDGGGGDDLIFGDSARFFAPLHTGLKRIDDATEALAGTLLDVLEELRDVAIDHDIVEATLHGANDPQRVEIGNDIIDGGDGNDTIVADNGTLVAPSTVRQGLTGDDLQTSALELYHSIRDLEHVATDFEHLVDEAELQLEQVLVDEAIANNPQKIKPQSADLIDLDLRNLVLHQDVVGGGAGSDLIVGDDALIITPVAATEAVADGAPDPLQVPSTELKAVKDALNAARKDRNDLLRDHVAGNHVDADLRGPSNKDLELIPVRFGYDYHVGNDTLSGGNDADLIIGDFGVVVLPALLQSPTDVSDAKRITQGAAKVARSFDDLLRDPFAEQSYEHRFAEGDSDDGGDSDDDFDRNVFSGSDLIDGNGGDDVIFGDNARVLPVVEENDTTVTVDFVAEMLHGDSDGDSDGRPDLRRGDDRIFGSEGNDIAFGQGGDDHIDGGIGNDRLFGGSGDDTIVGGEGNDRLVGGSGSDTVIGEPGDDVVKYGGSDGEGDSSDDDIDVTGVMANPWLGCFLADVKNAGGSLDRNGELWLSFKGDTDDDGGA